MSRLESLLGQPAGTPSREEADAAGEAREEHPDASWRADALARSRHARLAAHIRRPLDDRRPGPAREVLATVCRGTLVDLAPVLLLLPRAERHRCQVLATLARTAFDFARQSGVEGERLAALNRVGFTLEQALDGEPVGQPVYLGMAREEERRPWDRKALDQLLALAVAKAVRRRPETTAEARRDAESLAGALHRALVGEVATPVVASAGGAVVRVRFLTDLDEGLRRGLAGLPVSELPIAGDPERPLDRRTIGRAVEAESARLRPLLAAGRRAVADVSPAYRGAYRFLLLASLALLDQIDRRGWEIVERPPRLGLVRRLWLLARARL